MTIKNNIKIYLCCIVMVMTLGSKVYSEEMVGTSTLPKAPYVLSQTIKQWQRDGRKVVLVDVRMREEYETGHLKEAINIPYNEVEQRVGEFTKKDVEYVFYCIYSSWRAPYSANVLVDLGYDNIYVMEGGIASWNAGGQVIYALNAEDVGQVAAYPENLEKILHHPLDKEYKEKINLTLEQLAYYDGMEGRLAYVAVENIIYDVTQSRLWRGGVHDPSHNKAIAGRDLTDVLKYQAKHGIEHLQRFPIVGYVIESDQ
ncbi:hypothetical protein MNBD_GAMMA03-990 [hydrothermal vent metagenome]|uniref:Rhodanese domain-containing protein n=1 Tax=hydrothermal vent metagenome TaxID=652676 RepID=A0A3B0W3J4_9ZZZZ